MMNMPPTIMFQMSLMEMVAHPSKWVTRKCDKNIVCSFNIANAVARTVENKSMPGVSDYCVTFYHI